MAAQLALGGLLGGRFLPGVTVASINIGGMTRPEARAVLLDQATDTSIQFKAAGTDYTIGLSDIGAEYDINSTLDQAYLIGRDQAFLPLGAWNARNTGSLAYSYRLDALKEQAFVDKVVAASGKAPVDASIVIKDGVPAAQDDQDGLALNALLVFQTINAQIGTAHVTPTELKPSVQQARIQTADLTSALSKTQELLATPITITYQGRAFKPTAANMSDWITYSKTPVEDAPGLTPAVSQDGIKHYLQSLAVQINLNPVNRKLNVMNGDSKEVQAGKDGLQLDQDALAGQIAKAVDAKQVTTLEAPTKKVPFQTEYNRTISLDYGKYIEINLKTQHLWVYQDHNLIYESSITSGATGAGFPTVQGLFSIQAKQTDRNLNGYAIGYNYNVFVHYWMPFYGNYGLHDASWRSSFGGQDYYYGGSHGCVNLPNATAAFLFGWADVGTPVWVHS